MPPSSEVPAAIRKATQALNYFAHKAASGAPIREMNKMKALKLLFFADRYHLRKYGRPVSDCAYFAMKDGPVASEAKHVAEENPRLTMSAHAYSRRYVRRKGYNFSSVADVDKNVLSETDIEALEFAWQNFGHYTQFQLRDITHHYPEWRRHARTLRQGSRRVEMDYADFFEEPAAGYNVCHPLSAPERRVALDLFRDRQAFDARWN
jgi:uncharacterized phage-associated protein